MLLFSVFLALHSILLLAASSISFSREERDAALTYTGKQKDFWGAILANNLEAVSKYLDDPEVDPAINDNMAFRFACKAGLTDIVRLLLRSKKVNPGACDDQAIIRVTSKGYQKRYVEILKMLLADDRVNPGARDNEALFVADDECLEELLKHPKVDPSARDNQLIIDAACGNRAPRLSYLLNSKGLNIDPGAQDNVALDATIRYRDYANFSLLCAHQKVDPRARNYEAVRQAAKLGYRRMLRTLLGHRLVNKEEATRVIYRTIGCFYSTVWETVFRRIGTDIPMKIAIDQGEFHMAKYLLDHHYTEPGVYYVGGPIKGSGCDASVRKPIQQSSSSSSSIPPPKNVSHGIAVPPQAMTTSENPFAPASGCRTSAPASALSSNSPPSNINIPQMVDRQCLSLMPSRPNPLKDAPIYVPTPSPRPPFLSGSMEPAMAASSSSSSPLDITQQMRQMFGRFMAAQKGQSPQRQLGNIRELMNGVFQEEVMRLRYAARGIEERDRKRRRMNSEEEMDVEEQTEDDRK
jgi:hypothetical protein